MSLMWMPAQTTVPPCRIAASAAGTQRAVRREDDHGIEFVGWPFGCVAGPARLRAHRANSCDSTSAARVPA